MSVSAISGSNYVSPSMVTSGSGSNQTNLGTDSDNDGDGSVKRSHGHGHGHGHGQMQSALMQAFQSLGLSPTDQTGTNTSSSNTNSTSQSSPSADIDGDADGSTSATGNLKSDMRKLMHALSEAVNADKSSNTTAGATGTGDSKSSFASGLSALITQVSNGNAPADLQNAFSQVAKDLQATGSDSTSTALSTATSSVSTPQVSLQELLTQLQQNLGYGATANNAASIGNFLSAQA